MALALDAGPTDVPLLYETIGENLANTVAKYPNEEALVVPYQGVRLTYAEFSAEVDRVARGLLAIGVEPGDRVGIRSARDLWIILWLPKKCAQEASALTRWCNSIQQQRS